MLRRARVLLCVKPNFRQSSWEILGVDRMSTPDEVRMAYQKLVAVHHPDKGGSSEEFQKIYNAYQEVLRGAPGHMVHAEETPMEQMESAAKTRIDNMMQRFGLKVQWEFIGNPHVDKKLGGSTTRKCIILGGCYWFLFACDPARPMYIVYVMLALGADCITGWVFVYLVALFLLWYSLYSRQVPGFFTSGGSYWAFDRPNALTMAYGIPNYTNSDARVLQASKGYRNLLQTKEQEEEPEEHLSSMQRTTMNVDSTAKPLRDIPLKSL
eukprot:TRINITY_DN4368_c0_g1_i2.p1 TRINITY_DN4368_c0_g1~~TRINITY_DN4368_c0_g1_i2.p1  ORF type:complete len:267 (+),score=50.18 TRINITY_DN4368_c0_g1_i2:38-838(+)